MYGRICSGQHKEIARAKIQTYIDERPFFYSYLRVLNNLLSFVDNSHVANKEFYVNLLKSEMGSAYLCLLYFFMMSEAGENMFLSLETKYKLLENLNKDKVFEV